VRGVYLLFLRIGRDSRIRVGSLGVVGFRKGLYVYVGSAQNNLEKRVRRHLSREKKLRWHIDYLTLSRVVKVVAVCAYELGREYECVIAGHLQEISEEVVDRFGSSDCSCRGHLFRVSGSVEDICGAISRRVRAKHVRLV